MRVLGILLVAACATARPAPQHMEPRPITVERPAVQPPAVLDEVSVKTRTHAWFAAADRFDIAGVTGVLAPSFVLFDDSRTYDAALLTKVMHGRIEQHWPVRSRTWSEERVLTSANTAVFIGRALEAIPAHGDRPALTEDGYNTVVWVHDGKAWVIAHAQWQRAGLDAERQRWNEMFKTAAPFNRKPNQLLVDTVKGRKAGTALDVAMGQGRNALFLASQGWRATGIDISDEGIRQAKAEAAKQKLKLDTIEADIEKYDYGSGKWDLVTLIYAGDDAKLVERLKPSLKKGGLFVCEYFHAQSEVAAAGAGGWDTGELAALFKDGYKVLRDEVVEDTADWAGQRKTKLVRFVAQKL